MHGSKRKLSPPVFHYLTNVNNYKGIDLKYHLAPTTQHT
jgi:hypothetical protein